jgi:hypothetical protein
MPIFWSKGGAKLDGDSSVYPAANYTGGGVLLSDISIVPSPDQGEPVGGVLGDNTGELELMSAGLTPGGSTAGGSGLPS